jgi:hypothetical protein
MNCCNDMGNCTQGRDCPIRKQRMKETNEAYVKGFLMGQEDPLDDLAETFKALLAMMTLVLGVWIVCLVIWGK